MKGALVPVVFLPRYTTLLEFDTFTTVPLDVQPYCRGAITLWRGPLPAPSGSPTFEAMFEDSHDAVNWTELAAVPELATDQPMVVSFLLNRRWLRLRVALDAGGSPVPGVTCWAVGMLEERVGPAS